MSVKEDLGIKAIECLKELGELFAEGDPVAIADCWFRDGEKIVIAAKEEGILNANIDKYNPFYLYYINDNPCLPDYNADMAAKATQYSIEIKAILDTLFKKISDAEDTFAIDKEVEGFGELILAYEDRNVSPSIVHSDGEPDHLGDDCRWPRPSLDHCLLPTLRKYPYLLEQLGVDIRAFFRRP